MFANVRTDAHHSRRICIPSMLDLPPPGLRVNVFCGNGVIMERSPSPRERSIIALAWL
jgi:hypothetical protein